MSEMNVLKKGLLYVISNKEGRVDEFTNIFGNHILDSFEYAGFINVGYIKWVKLRSTDEYYRDLYGHGSYWYERLKIAWKKISHKTSK